MYREVGDLAYAADLAESFLKAERVAPLEPAVSADVHTALVSIYFERGDVLRAERAARHALAAVEHGANPRVRADAMWSASRVLAESQRWDEALDLVRRARVIIDDLGDQSRLTRVHTAYAFLCLESEPPRLDEAAVNLDKAESLMGPEATAEDQAYLHLERARLALLRESYEDAVRLSERAVAHAQDDPLHRGRCLFVRGRALAGAGRPAPAVESFQEAAATFAKQGARRQEASCWREIGELHLASGDLEAGLGSLRAGLEALDPRRSRA
jgi:tetratricopeptide (TPR) repeat protein